MSLVTRCPTCATTFRVLPAQLSARGGRVRCGKCSSAFDGVGNLLTDEAVAALPDEPSPQLGLFEAREQSATAATEPDQAVGTPHESAEPGVREPIPAIVKAPVVVVTETAGLAAKSQPEDLVVPAFLAPERPRATHLFVWFLLAAVALCAFALQAGMHFRTEIGVLLPQARPYLETACDFLGCEVRLPRRAELLSIESSDLQADGQRAGVIVLNALLRNRAPFAQEFPDLELTLTDQGERAVIRKVLKPREYLQEKRAALAQGMGGGAEEAVRLFLDTGGILATGYQLFLFYPCPPASTSPFWQLSYPSRCQDSGKQ
jgi:predicted Zn finger-like uncharacterized protein